VIPRYLAARIDLAADAGIQQAFEHETQVSYGSAIQASTSGIRVGATI
jgi:hypothetical protein